MMNNLEQTVYDCGDEIEVMDWAPYEGETPHNFIKRWVCTVCGLEASVIKKTTWHHESVGRTDERNAMQYLIDHGCTHVSSNPDDHKRVDVNVFSEGGNAPKGKSGGKARVSVKSGGKASAGGKK
jgi:hypothetical protein